MILGVFGGILGVLGFRVEGARVFGVRVEGFGFRV